MVIFNNLTKNRHFALVLLFLFFFWTVEGPVSDSTTVVTGVLGMRLSSDLWLICAGSVSKVLLSGLTIGSCVDVLIDNSQQEIAARNKKVKIGDKYGWDSVSEYEGNPLADDSDDERRL
jgi:hypothetical protein